MSHYIVIDDNDTKIAYTDSGLPPCGGVYTTIFAVHGVVFNSYVFQKISSLSNSKGVRFVAINRRGYKGSTPFSDSERRALSGTEVEKVEWLRNRGLEVAIFIDKFIQQENLPPVSPGGKTGGVVLLGWSLGNTITASVIANIDALPSPSLSRFTSYLRGHIMQEPPSISFGLPLPPQTYSPQLDTCIPEKTRISAFTLWITSYFQHGDLSTRDLDILEYVLPATFRTPSIWNMTLLEIAEIVDESQLDTIETPFMINFMQQTNAIYQQAIFEESVNTRLPHLKTWQITGDSTASFSLAALWSIEKDDISRGGNHVQYKMISGANHFMHWDDPGKTLDVYIEALG